MTNTAPSGTPLQVAVTATYTFAYITGVGPLFGFTFAGTVPLSSTATMRYER